MRKLLPVPFASVEPSAAKGRAPSAPAWPLLLRALGAVVGLALLSLIVAKATAGPTDPGEAGDPQTESSLCRVHGGGCLNVAGGVGTHIQATFGGDVARLHGDIDPTQSSWEHVYRDNRTILIRFSSLEAHVVRCRPEPHGSCPPPDGATRADFEGTGKVVLGDGGSELDANFQASVIDVGACEGSPRDAYSITIRRGLVVGQGDVVHELSGNLECGNLKVGAPWRASERGGR
jgi:hypothetical protein